MRRFSADYLGRTREGMWASRAALSPLSLPDRTRVVDVGCGTGELARVLAEETPGEVVGVDRDRSLLAHAPVQTVQGDALTLPFASGSADLVTCQALLVNLPDPVAAIEEFARVSSDLVAVVEPDNRRVTVDSTVETESGLAARAREHYIRGVGTDVTLGAVPGLFERAGLNQVETRRHEQVRTVEPPYGEEDFEAARRKATGARIEETRGTLRTGGLDEDGYDDLRREWRSMGRTVADQMAAGEYRRREMVPFFVTVGRVARASETSPRNGER